MTVTINEECFEIPDHLEPKPEPEPEPDSESAEPEPEPDGKQVGEFEIEIGTQKNDEGEIKLPDNSDELVNIIKANVEHNCNKMLQFCSELLAKEFNKKKTDLESQITNLTDDNKRLLEDNKKLKTQIERSMTNIKDHFTISYDTDNS
jgi:hypothetical protein